MKKLIVISFLTLDGVMQAPGGKKEDSEDGFKYGGWQEKFIADYDLHQDVRHAGALLLGRKTYDIFAAYWPTTGKAIKTWGPFMNDIPKYIASKTLKKTTWQNCTLLKGHLAKAVGKIKREAKKDIYMFGSGDLCQSLMRHHLIDEYLLMLHPLVLGTGKQLFPRGCAYQDLKLTKSKITKSGILVLTYKVSCGA